ncbi:MAG: hypothetical protein K9J79_07890 [Desulfobacteraceae bacterium]|nr:hypothetical protein [Desulfobacteraceae bacterium]
MTDLKRLRVKTHSGQFDITAEAVWIGADLLVIIHGGERPHIGAVAAAQPRHSLKNPENLSATSSVLTYLGHKEDTLAKTASETIAVALNTNVVVTAGIHWDMIGEADIETVMENSQNLIANMIQRLKREDK